MHRVFLYFARYLLYAVKEKSLEDHSGSQFHFRSAPKALSRNTRGIFEPNIEL